MINLLKFLNLISAVFCFLLSVVVLQCRQCSWKNIQKLNFAVFLLTFTSGIWSANMFFQLFFLNNAKLSELFNRLNWSGGLIVATYTYLSLVMTKQDKKTSWLSIAQFVIAALFTIIAFTNYGIKKVVNIFPLQREYGSLAPLFRLWLLVSIVYSLYLTIKYYVTTEGVERLKFQYYILGLVVYAILGIAFNSILPLVGMDTLVYLTPIGSFIWVLATFYSIHYYKLLDIEVIFCDAIRYSVFILIGLILNYILNKIFFEFLSLSGLLSSTLSLIIVGTIYFVTPIRERINNTIRNLVLRRRTMYQKLLENTTKAVVEILDLNSLFDYVLKQIRNSLGATKICIFLQDEDIKDENGQPVYRLVSSCGIEGLKTIYFKQYKIINWLKQHKEPLLLDIAYHLFDISDYRELTESFNLFGAIIVVPIIYRDELVGIMTLDQKKVDGTLFDMEDIEMLKTLSEQLAIAIKNSKMFHELNTAYMQITRALTLAMESKDEYLIGHSDNVTKYAVMLAKHLGLSEKDIYIIAQAGVLHDLGKIGIHDYILNKPGKLTKEEWEEVKQHPIKGAKILQSLPFMKEVAEVILHHHEHYDGSGYPDGLKGEQIPLLSRILTLADSVDAMMSSRPYKERPLTFEEMISEIVSQKGRHFDPYLVDKFVEIIKLHPEIFQTKFERK